MIARARVLTPYAIAGAGLVWFLAWSLTKIREPGLNHDEALFVNAALGGDYPDKAFISREFFGFPTMLLPYIGALKAWLYAPIFAAFGVSVETIRIPAVILGTAAIVLAAVTARRLFGLWPAALLAFLLGTDVAFAAFVKADLGPVAVSAFLRVATLAAYFSFVRTRSFVALWICILSLGLGVFNKLDFLLFVAAIAAAALTIDRRRIAAAARSRPVATLAPLGVLAVWLLFVAHWLLFPALHMEVSGIHDSWTQHVSPLPRLVAQTFSGQGPYEAMTTVNGVAGTDWFTAAFALTFVAVVVVHIALLWRGDRRDDSARASAAMIVMLAVLAVGFAVMKRVEQAHHVFQAWPLPYLLAVALIAPGRRIRPAAASVAVAFCAAAVAAHGVVALDYARAYGHEERWRLNWSPEIYSVAARIRAEDRQVDSVLTADWGAGQVFALIDEAGRRRFLDLWPEFLRARTPRDRAALAAARFRGRRVLVIGHIRGAANFPGADAGFRSILATLDSSRVETIYRGRYFAVWLVDARTLKTLG